MKSNEKQNKRPTRPSINGDPKTEGRTTQRPVVKKKKKKKLLFFSRGGFRACTCPPDPDPDPDLSGSSDFHNDYSFFSFSRETYTTYIYIYNFFFVSTAEWSIIVIYYISFGLPMIFCFLPLWLFGQENVRSLSISLSVPFRLLEFLEAL